MRKRSKKKANKIFKSIFSILLGGTFLWLLFQMWNIKLLANKTILIIIGIVALIVILLIVGLIKSKSKVSKGILYTLSTIFIVIFSVGIYYMSSTLSFLNVFGNTKTKYDYYYVMVLKNSKYEEIEDLQNKNIGLYLDNKREVLDKISIKFNDEVYDDANELLTDFFDKKIDAILISDANECIIEEIDEDFASKVKIIKRISLKKKNEVEVSNKNITKETFILYISGIDTYGKIGNVSRSDVNIIATINPNKHEILLTSIPRDFYVKLHKTKNNPNALKDKLTHAGIYGVNESITTIEDLLDIDIDHYIKVNFDTVVKLVDQLGGITIYSDKSLKLDECYYRHGNNNVNGKCALRFARERHSYATGDRHRGENQEEVIKAIINKVQSSTAILTNYNNILANLKNNMETSLTPKNMKDLIGLQMGDMPTWDVKTVNLDGKGGWEVTYSGGSTHLSVMIPDQETVDKAHSLISGMLKGKSFDRLGI